MIRAALLKVANEYSDAKKTQFSGNALAEYLRNEATRQVKEGLPDAYKEYRIKGSAGEGQWAHVPWVAIFNPLITTKATDGYYVVYLFDIESKKVHISLNQGTTAVYKALNKKAHETLKARANLYRQFIPQYIQHLFETEISFSSKEKLATQYCAGHIIGKTYSISDFPSEHVLQVDISRALDAYSCVFEKNEHLSSEEEYTYNSSTHITESRKFKHHKTIERSSNYSKKVKQYHGYTCKACGSNMEMTYGDVGKNYIEAHHIIPVSTIMPGEYKKYSIETDFTVLCPNCHSMIHRLPEPATVERLRQLLKENKVKS